MVWRTFSNSLVLYPLDGPLHPLPVRIAHSVTTSYCLQKLPHAPHLKTTGSEEIRDVGEFEWLGSSEGDHM